MTKASSKPACARWRRQVKEDPFDWGPGRWSWSESMLEWQRGQCALCGHSLYVSGKALDHSHETGLVRGYLCTRCNCHRADFNTDYTRGMNPAAMLGIVKIYRNPRGWPVMQGERVTAEACFTLAGLAFDALPHHQRTDYTDGELVAARDHLWQVEGWPIPAEWRWQKPSPVGRVWSKPPADEPLDLDSLLANVGLSAVRSSEEQRELAAGATDIIGTKEEA